MSSTVEANQGPVAHKTMGERMSGNFAQKGRAGTGYTLHISPLPGDKVEMQMLSPQGQPANLTVQTADGKHGVLAFSLNVNVLGHADTQNYNLVLVGDDDYVGSSRLGSTGQQTRVHFVRSPPTPAQ